MNNLLFTALIIALIYYFFYYLPFQKKLNTTNPPLTKPLTHQFTQTEPLTEEKVLEIEELKTQQNQLEQDYRQEMKEKREQITNLQSQIRDLAKRPLKPTNSKGTQTDDKDLTNTLDTLIKDIQNLNNSLD